MKVLKTLVVMLVLLTALFFAVGFITPKVEYGHEITVTKSVEEAWAVSEDPAKHSEWIKGLKSERLISGEKGMPGSKYKVLVDPGEGQEEFEMTETLLERKVNESVKMHFDSEMMDFEQTISFASSGEGTKIKTESTASGKSAVMRSMFALMEMIGGSFQKQEEENMNNLKTVIESNTTDYFAPKEEGDEVL